MHSGGGRAIRHGRDQNRRPGGIRKEECGGDSHSGIGSSRDHGCRLRRQSQ